MASATTIYITPRQRQRLFARAKKRKTSFSEELRSAVELYLDLPPEVDQAAFSALVRRANESMKRSVARLDEAVARLQSATANLETCERKLHELEQRHLRRAEERDDHRSAP